MSTVPELARAREIAAADLDTAIAAVGRAYREYVRLTSAVGARVSEDLAPRVETPIILAMAHAGLSAVLERKLVAHGKPASLRALVEEQHQRLGSRLAGDGSSPR
jgi:hypothetical protein